MEWLDPSIIKQLYNKIIGLVLLAKIHGLVLLAKIHGLVYLRPIRLVKSMNIASNNFSKSFLLCLVTPSLNTTSKSIEKDAAAAYRIH